MLKSTTFTSVRTGLRKFATNQEIVALDEKYVCKWSEPIPVAIERAERIHVYDVEGKKYMDFVSCYSAANQGHCHPKILKALIDQASKVPLTTRAMHNTQMSKFGKLMSDVTGYDKILPQNGGVEAVETACKVARKWGYTVKGIPPNKANLLFPTNNYWGRTITASGSCDDYARMANFGPFTPGFELFQYGNVEALRTKLKNDPHVCGVCIETIQGEGGIIIPHDGYVKAVRDLCTEYNVLMIADEIQTGYGRTGQMWNSNWESVRPDIITCGKSMSGGFIPVSAAICDSHIMDVIKPGDHGSTYGGNPLAMAVCHASLQTLIEEGMIENSRNLGPVLLSEVRKINSHLFEEVRGRGLFCGIELKKDLHVNGVDMQNILMEKGLLAKATKGTIIRFAPPLVITKEEIHQAVGIVSEAMKALEQLNEERGNAKKQPLKATSAKKSHKNSKTVVDNHQPQPAAIKPQELEQLK